MILAKYGAAILHFSGAERSKNVTLHCRHGVVHDSQERRVLISHFAFCNFHFAF